jgi:hypothetical protein
MPGTLQELDQGLGEQETVVSHRAALAEDAYWARSYWKERYYCTDLEYEDYAPAYCVGYIGCAQYGGEFADAERSLCANWERIKSDSRLSLEQAMPAIKAAWDRAARLRQRRAAEPANEPVYDEALQRHDQRLQTFTQNAAAAS